MSTDGLYKKLELKILLARTYCDNLVSGSAFWCELILQNEINTVKKKTRLQIFRKNNQWSPRVWGVSRMQKYMRGHLS